MNARARHQIVLLPLLLAPLAAIPQASEAQSIRRCNGPDGTTIFTDRTCESLGATLAKEMIFDHADPGSERVAPGMMGVDGAVGGFAIRGCARSQGELIAGVRQAVETGDVNLLANYYHWTGTSSSAAVGLMDRLDTIARNSLAGVQFDYPEPSGYTAAAIETPNEPTRTPMPAADRDYTAGTSFLDQYRAEHDDIPLLASGTVEASTPLEEAPAATVLEAAPYASASPQPVALRVNDGGGGTRFSLRRNAGCWFIQF